MTPASLLPPAALVAAVLAAAVAGRLLARRQGWDPFVHRAVLTVALLPWFVRQASLARLARNPAINPLASGAGPADLWLADWAGPVLVLLLLAVCLMAVRRLRHVSALLPLAAAAVTWWVTLPLYGRAVARGWFFLTPDVSSVWLLAYFAAATALVAGYATASGAEPSGPGTPG